MKTKEELNALKSEVETLSKKLAELTEDEIEKVAGGIVVEDWTSGQPYIPQGWTRITVVDSRPGVALCPFDSSELDYKEGLHWFADWAFCCPACQKWFCKFANGGWYVSDTWDHNY